jgi:tRNA threonylcarbamoyladenosine biosynthesis protein TsaE
MGDIQDRTGAERLSTASEAETVAAGRSFATRLHAGAVVLLFGDLGAGKTAFVRGVAAGLGVDSDQVSSPTFTLIQEYQGGRLPLFHVDLYRLGIAQEIDELGLEELGEGGVLAIEWADKLPRAISGSIVVRIEQGEDDERWIEIRS